jgi:hypothetical protein
MGAPAVAPRPGPATHGSPRHGRPYPWAELRRRLFAGDALECHRTLLESPSLDRAGEYDVSLRRQDTEARRRIPRIAGLLRAERFSPVVRQASEQRQDAAEAERMAWTRERFKKEGVAIAGAECLYREPPLFVHARVIETVSHEQGLEFVLESLPTAGFAVSPGQRFTIGFGWEYLPVTLELIGCGYISLSIYFDQDLIPDLLT